MEIEMTNPHEIAYQDAVQKLGQLGDYDRAFGEVASRRTLERLAKIGYKQSRGQACVHRLLGKKSCQHGADCLPPAHDHITLWLRDGEPAMTVSHLYGISDNDLKATLAYADEKGLSVYIDAGLSWHYPSSTVAVILTRKGEHHPSGYYSLPASTESDRAVVQT
jgi:hypothetical protein